MSLLFRVMMRVDPSLPNNACTRIQRDKREVSPFLVAFLEASGLGRISAAFGLYGVYGLRDLVAAGIHFDDDICRDIGTRRYA